MDLCSQLHLQLLVVTTSDKIHIVEPYISYVHYVQQRFNRESVLFDMPIKQFEASWLKSKRIIYWGDINMHLTPRELALYQLIRQGNHRLEQEHLPQEYIAAQFNKLLEIMS